MKYLLFVQLGIYIILFVQFQVTIYQANLSSGTAQECQCTKESYVRTIGWNNETFSFRYYWECKEGEDHKLNIFGF